MLPIICLFGFQLLFYVISDYIFHYKIVDYSISNFQFIDLLSILFLIITDYSVAGYLKFFP